MNGRRREWNVAAIVSVAGVSLAATGQVTHQHELTVAANPGLVMYNDDVDWIVSRMNTLIASTTYPPWDVACTNVRFVRKGDVIQDRRLDVAGTYPQLANELASYAPAANVLVVGGINCGDTLLAAGCGDIGREPLIASAHAGYEDQLWVHERGHNVGLKHSAERPAVDTAVDPKVGMNVMFWKLGQGHTGKLVEECQKFAGAAFKSIVVVGNQSGGGAFAQSRALGSKLAQSTQGGRSTDATAKTSPLIVPDRGVLTAEAYRVVGVPWVDRVPVVDILKLSPPDVDSIRKVLQGEISDLWAQAVSALALVGGSDDIALVRRPLELQMPEATAQSTMQDRRRVRALLRAKLSAPVALGVMANRFKSESAVEALEKFANVEGAKVSVGEPAAASLSKQALTGLSVANMPRAQTYLENVLKAQEIKAPNLSWPKLSVEETKRLRSDQANIQKMGVDSFIQKGAF